MKKHCLLLVSAIASVVTAGGRAAEPLEEVDGETHFEVEIDVGRFGAMLQQIGEVRPERSDRAEIVTPLAEIASDLRVAVWRLNAQRDELCRARLYVKLTCVAPFNPPWLNKPARI